MKIIYTHINTRTRTCTRKRTHTRAHAFKYTHTVWWPLKVWYNIGCAGNSAYECRVPSVELGAPFGQLFMHACVCYACRVWCVCDAHDWCLPAPDCAFGVYFYVASFGRQPSKQPTNQPPRQRAQWKCCWFFYDSNQVKWICIIVHGVHSWVHSASRVAAPLLIAFMVLSTLVVSLSRLCLPRNRSHSYSHNAVALIKWHASI